MATQFHDLVQEDEVPRNGGRDFVHPSVERLVESRSLGVGRVMGPEERIAPVARPQLLNDPLVSSGPLPPGWRELPGRIWRTRPRLDLPEALSEWIRARRRRREASPSINAAIGNLHTEAPFHRIRWQPQPPALGIQQRVRESDGARLIEGTYQAIERKSLHENVSAPPAGVSKLLHRLRAGDRR